MVDLNATLPDETVIHVWKGDYEGLDYLDELNRVKLIKCIGLRSKIIFTIKD